MSSAVANPIRKRAPVDPSETPNHWLSLGVVATASFLGTLDFFIVNLAMPAIRSDLGATNADVQLVIACYSLAYAVCLVTGGRLGDVYGRKRTFIVGLIGFTVTSVLCGLAWSPNVLIAARVLQGVAGAIMFPQVLSIIQVTFPPAERGPAFATLGAVQGAASFLGLIFGGVLVEANLFGLGWRPIFLVNLPVGLLTCVAAWRLLPESRSPRATRLDLGGVAIATVALLLIVVPLAEGREAGWPLWAFVGLVAAGPAAVAFLVWERFVERRGGAPLVELRLFRHGTFVAGLLTTVAFFAGLSAMFLTITVYFQDGLKLSPAQAGWAFAPFAPGYFLGSATCARATRKLGVRVLNLGAAVMSVGLAAILVLVATRVPSPAMWELAPALFLYGIGQGLLAPPLMRAVLSVVPASDAGSASGVLGTVQQVAGSIGVTAVTGVFFAAQTQTHDFAAALRAAFACNLTLIVVTFALAFFLPRSALVHAPATAVEV